jgi:hypothetical protein
LTLEILKKGTRGSFPLIRFYCNLSIKQLRLNWAGNDSICNSYDLFLIVCSRDHFCEKYALIFKELTHCKMISYSVFQEAGKFKVWT